MELEERKFEREEKQVEKKLKMEEKGMKVALMQDALKTGKSTDEIKSLFALAFGEGNA